MGVMAGKCFVFAAAFVVITTPLVAAEAFLDYARTPSDGRKPAYIGQVTNYPAVRPAVPRAKPSLPTSKPAEEFVSPPTSAAEQGTITVTTGGSTQVVPRSSIPSG